MTYTILSSVLHEVADRAKQHFSDEYGAKAFKCEQPIDANLPLKPTWQATLPAGYCLCIEVRESPFSNTLYEFVTKCVSAQLPIRFWVAVPHSPSATFSSELKQAREVGIGVLQIGADNQVHEFHRPMPLSLFGLKKTNLKEIPRGQRDDVKNAESTFLEGSPSEACQTICQALEQLTRDFAEYTYNNGLWSQKAGAATLTTRYFQTKPWASVLEEMEARIDVSGVKKKAPLFTRHAVVRVRGHTDWRNDVSHKPKTYRERKLRDAKLRTMFESTRDTLVEWYAIAKPFRLIR